MVGACNRHARLCSPKSAVREVSAEESLAILICSVSDVTKSRGSLGLGFCLGVCILTIMIISG